MMQAARLSLLISIICNCLLIFNEAQDDGNAFDNNVNHCLFDRWKVGTNRILATKVKCNGRKRTGLCYGLNGKALFAVCYNKISLIPDFTGHIVDWVSGGATGRDDWRNETGKYGRWKTNYDDIGVTILLELFINRELSSLLQKNITLSFKLWPDNLLLIFPISKELRYICR